MTAIHEINVQGSARKVVFSCSSEDNVLNAMKKAKLAVVPVGCRGGGCGVCKVKIISGLCEYGKMSRAHISLSEEQDGSFGLACKLFPRTDLNLQPIGDLFKKMNVPDGI